MEFVLLSIPFDRKSTLRQGAREGPHAIRAAFSEDVLVPYTELGVDLHREAVIVERGPVPNLDNYLVVESHIMKEVERIKKNQILGSLGGDHSITYPLVKGMKKLHGKLNLVYVSGHPDLHNDHQGDVFSHGCVMSRIVEVKLGGRMIQVGVRAATTLQRERAGKFGIEMIEARHWSRAVGLTLKGPTYLSIDLGVLDPAYAPGVGNPVPGGVSTRNLFDFLHALDADIVGFDICELNPRWDRAGTTALAAARLLQEVIGICVLRHGKRKR